MATRKTEVDGGLPDNDKDLDAFGAAAAAAFTPKPRRRAAKPSAAPEPQPAAPAEATPPSEAGPPSEAAPPPEAGPSSVVRTVPAPVPAPAAAGGVAAEQPVVVRIPQLGAPGQDATQCTVMVDRTVRKRFARYQSAQQQATGHEPTNAVVVRRAMLQARKNDRFAALRQTVRLRQQPLQEEDHDAEGLFGEVPERRTERGAVKDSAQQSFRPSRQELAVYDAYSTAYGFPSRSDFLNAVLDAFLPELPAKDRR
ncbi:hypothetical protein [Streptomyces sp. NPDC050504]|uniref:hypothetical protein n=1 Tax=Streptomyces sp. NPDC050504 TaxID=3365618 RepID=UPI0037991153